MAYLVDEDDNEIGFVLLDEDGNEVEYYYVEEEQPEEKNEFDIGLTKEVVAETTKDLNSIYHDGAAVAVELKDAFTDIKEALDFKGMFKKK